MFSNLRYILFPVLNITGAVLTAFAVIMLLPLTLAVVNDEPSVTGFGYGAFVTFIVGVFLFFLTNKNKRELVARDGFLLATIIWACIPLFASIPLYVSLPGLSFTHAYFEAISGTTTTCATVLTGLDTLPQSINFWRCFLSWIGGMGILVLAVAILPLLGVGGAQIFKAEASGPMKDSKLTPRIADTAKGLWWIYLTLTVACVLAYIIAGMSVFDALLHAFTTVSLGGFSSHDASFGYWNSDTIECVAIFFMFICGASFSLHFVALRKRSVIPYLHNVEFLCWLGICVVAVSTVTLILWDSAYYSSWDVALRHAAFNVISTISTTGFSTSDYNLWPIATPILMLACACFSTCGGSTGGGIKMLRSIILLKQTLREFTLLLHPKAVVPLSIGGGSISNRVVSQAVAYSQLWIVLILLGAIVMMATGLDLVTATSAIIACLTNTGPGLGVVGPTGTFAQLSDFQLWLCSFCMLVGRLEMMTVFVLFTRAFWRL
ncbi:MAG: TrkH family potassium uptake protein [Duodenibacillus sp.]|nr:TrkH family potassium uptake protein [Duodenibacillus sp.]